MPQELALIVHPLFKHTLPKQSPRPPRRWDSLPGALLHRVASALTTAQDLANFEVLNRSCWYVPTQKLAVSPHLLPYYGK